MIAKRNPLPALVLIAALLAVLAAAFAWVGGWIGPKRVSGDSIANALQDNTGKPFPGFRRAHAKGICVAGHFDATGAGTALSKAALFERGRTPVIGRFSLAGGNPTAPDGRNVFHALGLRFTLPHGEEWRMAIDHTPIFVVSTPAAFQAFQIAGTPDPATRKPDPEKIKAFVATHPETKAFMDFMKTNPIPSSFANGTYYSINAFTFIDAQGRRRAVRWQFEPEAPFAAIPLDTLDSIPPNYFFDEALARLGKAPLRWHLILIPANPGDRTDNATVRWTGPHQRIDAGELVLERGTTEEAGNCRDFNYDPLILPSGVERSDDPLLPARSAAYSASFRRRAIEGPRPDAITLQTEKGAAR